MALVDNVIEAYPLALRSKEDISFEVIEAGTSYFIGIKGLRLIQFDKKSDAEKFVTDLNVAIDPIVAQIQDFYNTEVQKIISKV